MKLKTQWLLAVSVRNADSVPSCRVRGCSFESHCVFSVDKEYEMSNAEFGAYQEMLRGCEESLFSQQVGDDDEIIEDEQE